MEIGKKLEELRKQKGLTQLELAEKVSVSRQAVSRWEVGTSSPSLENLKTLSELYGVSLEYLLDDQSELQHEGEPQIREEKTCTIQKEEKTSANSVRKYKLVICIMGALLLVSLLVCIFLMNRPYEENNPIIHPMSEEKGDEIEPDGEFDFEW